MKKSHLLIAAGTALLVTNSAGLMILALRQPAPAPESAPDPEPEPEQNLEPQTGQRPAPKPWPKPEQKPSPKPARKPGPRPILECANGVLIRLVYASRKPNGKTWDPKIPFNDTTHKPDVTGTIRIKGKKSSLSEELKLRPHQLRTLAPFFVGQEVRIFHEDVIEVDLWDVDEYDDNDPLFKGSFKVKSKLAFSKGLLRKLSIVGCYSDPSQESTEIEQTEEGAL